jgi:predicted nucleic acid-binding protein
LGHPGPAIWSASRPAASGRAELDAATCELAATIAEQTGVRTLAALHLGAARRLGVGLTFLTFDVRQAQAGRALGLTVVGA